MSKRMSAERLAELRRLFEPYPDWSARMRKPAHSDAGMELIAELETERAVSADNAAHAEDFRAELEAAQRESEASVRDKSRVGHAVADAWQRKAEAAQRELEAERRVSADALREACGVLFRHDIGEYATDPDQTTTHTVDEWTRWFRGRAAARDATKEAE